MILRFPRLKGGRQIFQIFLKLNPKSVEYKSRYKKNYRFSVKWDRKINVNVNFLSV